MTQNNLGLHNLHKRKRTYQNLQPYPHSNKWIRRIDKAMYVLAIIVPIFVSSQVLKIWIYKEAAGVSILAWSMYLLNSMLWFVYGVVHKERPILFANTINMIINVLVIFGTILYG